MTVKELILELEQFDDNQQIAIRDGYYAHEIKRITQRNIISAFGRQDDIKYVCIETGTQIGGTE